jgi:hypothetical protein
MTDARVAASFEALSELSLSSLLSLSSSLSSAEFAAALVDCLDGADASVDPLSFDALEDDALDVLDELELCDEFADAAALAALCVDWFLELCCDDGCACGCWAGGCGLALAEDAEDGEDAGADGGVDWLAAGVLMLPCRTLEKLCVGALLFAPAEGLAGAAGAALIVSKMESVINRAAYA